jgi:hypothetical protein
MLDAYLMNITFERTKTIKNALWIFFFQAVFLIATTAYFAR